MTNQIPELPPVKIAFIIDNQVVDILHTDDRLAAIFLSEPIIKDITDQNKMVPVGAIYDPKTELFSFPASSEDLPEE